MRSACVVCGFIANRRSHDPRKVVSNQDSIKPVNNQWSDQSEVAVESSTQRLPWNGGIKGPQRSNALSFVRRIRIYNFCPPSFSARILVYHCMFYNVFLQKLTNFLAITLQFLTKFKATKTGSGAEFLRLGSASFASPQSPPARFPRPFLFTPSPPRSLVTLTNDLQTSNFFPPSDWI